MEYLQPWVVSGGKRSIRLASFFNFVIFLSLSCAKLDAKSTRMSSETDRLALLQFKAKISDDPYGIMGLWKDSIDFCQWYGVRCGAHHKRVTELNLFSLKLGGIISPHIGNLSFLHVLQLQNNSFTHHIPTEIGRLRRLQVLNLLNNTLGGEIPLNLSRCLQLATLILSNNELQGKIPPELGSLSKLQSFGLSRNNLTGALPSSVGNLTFLEGLSVAANNLVGTIPVTIGSLIHLRFLALGLNYLTGEVPDSVFNISSTEIFDVGGNQLRGHLPQDLFHKLANLQYLNVGENQFSGTIPVSLSNASNLQSLQLLQNKLTGKVPSLENLNKLRTLNVAGNQLGGSDVSEIDDLNFICSLANNTALRFLELGNNSFGGMLPVCLTNLSSQLIRLAISSNHISGSIPPDIDSLLGLEALVLADNSLTGTIPPTIGNLGNLVLLYLFENNLSGPIPSSLGMLSKLNEIDFSSNTLEGTIPWSLHNCTFLQVFILDQNNLTGSIPPQVLIIPSLSLSFSVSRNRLSGPLPEEVGKLTALYELDVSGNTLSGKIPDSLGECTSLAYLYLEGNNFQGSIPSSLSSIKGLQGLDVSSNKLSGQIPQFLASFVNLITLNLSFNDLEGEVPKNGVFTNATATWLEGNNKLCGGIPDFHLPECTSFPKRKRRRLLIKTKVIIATIAVAFGVAALLVLLLVFRHTRKRRPGLEELASLDDNRALQFVSYGDLHRATNGFSDGSLVGTGSFGYVYKGILGQGGNTIAIKVLNLNKFGASRSFAAECQALRNIRHRNLVKLLTVCSGVDYQGNEFKALLYEFMPNGSLEDWLHPLPTRDDEIHHDQTPPPRKLGLLTRLSIAIDVASLLEYLHHQFGTPLVHCDIKPSNILLDGDLSGHVSDFGLAKFLSYTGIIRNSTHVSSSTGIRGTIGYVPPEYGVGSELSTQGDVYSYGILLLEMFTGKRPTDEMFKEGLSLHLYAKMGVPSGVLEVLDPILQDLLETEDQVLNSRRSMRVMDCLVSIVEVGVACSHTSPTERMDMSMVTTKLSKIRENLSR